MEILQISQLPFDTNEKVYKAFGKIEIEKDGKYTLKGNVFEVIVGTSSVKVFGGTLEVLIKNKIPIDIHAVFPEKGSLHYNDMKFIGVNEVRIEKNEFYARSSETEFKGAGGLEKIFFGSMGVVILPEPVSFYETIIKGKNLEFHLRVRNPGKAVVSIEGRNIYGRIEGAPTFVMPRGKGISLYVENAIFPILKGVVPRNVLYINAKELMAIYEIYYNNKDISGNVKRENKIVKELLKIAENPEEFLPSNEYVRRLALNTAKWVSRYL